MFRFPRALFRRYASFQAGQPIHETRPHLVRAGELTTGISAMEYFNRRYRLAEQMPAKSLAIIPGNTVKYASGAVFYNFQQNNDLFYLTGWLEPDSVCVLEKPTEDPDSLVFHMVVPPKDENSELWEGARTGVDGVREIFNADNATDNRNLHNYLRTLLKDYKNVLYDFEDSKKSIFSRVFSSTDKQATNRESIESLLRSQNCHVYSLKNYLTELRAIKSNAELRVMRMAGKISGRAYNQAYAKRFKTEKGLHAFLEYRFISGGCDKSAYIPVVAGGSNALCIHYTRNDQVFKGDELVLVDAAGSLGGYCADISRTWPVSGKFSSAQAELYQAVLNVEQKCIQLCTQKQGYSLRDIHDESVRIMTSELRNCGFHGLTSYEVMRHLYPHYIGHNLGLDVHDVPSQSRAVPLVKGQVVTIEPGVYVPDDSRWPKHYRGMGIRIEDDIAVGEDNYVVLTAEAAKEIIDIETVAERGVTTKLEDEVVDVWSCT
ncbi:hypothetical protein KL918_003811 [Ogataea parapolymorpha]|uniref:Intermediate cleaving peptidase 55 n=1 Tax=Ogataea parapolymorpha (strain ATCC 26012 / BCRC 20466 / JCM 22074 / NRRL Y-7560 / DL-1) TaxID=871575 RepID=W1QK79_OGAPD|nr:Intermediate cleaving peptidase 55 [Ogataea parapolymorpha DL-1]ESX02263.1 Intermediate cleaving peptidase 55 [Ogataea parapolymorpha DL-1]KAG7866346.1 hypothetical protein KL918_003811 [Ogataea parapolymorpha]KAG7872974.1 hypothetical protein KL916_002704 [Ogataea parapolymorpha]